MPAAGARTRSPSRSGTRPIADSPMAWRSRLDRVARTPPVRLFASGAASRKYLRNTSAHEASSEPRRRRAHRLDLASPARSCRAVAGETPVPSLAPMLKRVTPAVVNIATRGTVAGTEPAAERPVLPALLRRAEHAARARVPERGLGRDRRCEERLHHHECTRGRERDGDHRAVARQPLAHGEGRRQGSGLGRRGAARSRPRTSWTFRSPTATRPRSAISSSRSATRSPRPHGHLRHHQRARPLGHQSRKATKISSRPTRRSTPAIPAARSST